MKKIIFAYFHFAYLIFCTNSSFRCLHEEIQKDVQYLESPSDQKRSEIGIGQVTPQPIRIHFDTTGLENLASIYKNFIKNNLIPYAMLFFKKRLKVRRDNKPIKFSQSATRCYQVTIPQAHKDTGVDADLLIYATYSYSYESYVAWAANCMDNPDVNGRPVAGQINFNAKYLDMNLNAFEGQITTILHEITHILGFSSYKYSKFVDKNGNKRTNVVGYESIRGYNRQIIQTPKVKEVAQQHFNCSKLSGVELENYGSSSTAGSHWERTILHNEAMTGSVLHLEAYSKFTMAILEDSGWYIPIYENLEPFFWGKNKGCDFIYKGCSGTNFPEFCSKSYSYGCTFHKHARGYCSNNYMADSLCKYMKPLSYGNCREKTNLGTKNYGEIYGLLSKCFESTLNQSSSNPRCYEYSCNADHTVLAIKANNGNYGVCRRKGENATIEGYNGSLLCPDPKIFCEGFYVNCPNYCSQYGYCVDGKCECLPGHGGKDCSEKCINNCNGHGVCNETLHCVCDKGYTGTNCTIKCNNTCSGHGNCNEKDQCVCEKGYLGKNCSIIECKPNCTNGHCPIPNKCLCNKGWSGENCTIPICSENCYGNGVCVGPEKCVCKKGWLQEYNCKNASCELLNNCSGNGFCASPNNCTCPGYTQPDCKSPICIKDCSNNGKCVSPNKCSCNSGFSGVYCQCSISICNNNGYCDENNKCVCNSGWTGSNCTDFVCDNNCHGNGKCVGPNTCKCNNDYLPNDCKNPNCMKLNNCSGFGKCISPNKCQCNTGYLEPDCKNFTCGLNCSYHGKCVDVDKCLCDSGFKGKNKLLLLLKENIVKLMPVNQPAQDLEYAFIIEHAYVMKVIQVK